MNGPDRPVQSAIDLTAQLGQMGATMRTFAPVVAEYYKALVDAKVPEELVGDLVMQWHGPRWRRHWRRGRPSRSGRGSRGRARERLA